MSWALLAIFMAGFSLGGSLIIAIGAQNAFVLKQGLVRRHVLAIITVCALSDALLIWSGAFALSAVAGTAVWVSVAARAFGAAFLVIYGLRAAWRVFQKQTLVPDGEAQDSLGRALALCLSFTFLNPHVYLDTVVLVGAIASRYEILERSAFCLGATTASFIWFFGLGFGARLLAPLFAKPIAWRILEAILAVVMLTIAIQIAYGG